MSEMFTLTLISTDFCLKFLFYCFFYTFLNNSFFGLVHFVYNFVTITDATDNWRSCSTVAKRGYRFIDKITSSKPFLQPLLHPVAFGSHVEQSSHWPVLPEAGSQSLPVFYAATTIDSKPQYPARNITHSSCLWRSAADTILIMLNQQ